MIPSGISFKLRCGWFGIFYGVLNSMWYFYVAKFLKIANFKMPTTNCLTIIRTGCHLAVACGALNSHVYVVLFGFKFKVFLEL